MASLSAFLTQVDSILYGSGTADDDELSQANRQRQIKAAIERYSNDRPREVTEDLTGDGGKYYDLDTDLTGDWDNDFSRVLRIQYPAPAVADDDSPVYLHPNQDWDDEYWDGSTRYLWLPNHSPASTESMRITYTAHYVLTSNAYAIPTVDFYAVCYLAAGLCCRAISTRYARTSDDTIAADSVDHSGRSERFAERANELIGMYNEHMGIGTDTESQAATIEEPAPAGAFITW